MSENNSGGGDKFLFFLAGAGIGAVVALLLAPKSGRETREMIARTASDGRDFITNKVSEGRQIVEERAAESVTTSTPSSIRAKKQFNGRKNS